MMSLNTLEFLAGQAAAAIRRNPLVTVAAITNVAVALTILGAFFLVALNLHQMAEREARAAVITCELSGDVPAADVEAALLGDLRVRTTKYVPKDQALRETAQRWGFDYEVLELLPNPLPDTIVIRVNDPEDISAVSQDADKVEGVSRAWYPELVTERILVVARGVKIAGLITGVLLILATLTVISTTIRLTIYARRREIRIMQLVGATHWFIRLPLLVEGVFYGIGGGIISAAMVLMAYWYLSDYMAQHLQFVTMTTDPGFLTAFGACLVLSGALFGAVGSFTGVRRYLSQV